MVSATTNGTIGRGEAPPPPYREHHNTKYSVYPTEEEGAADDALWDSSRPDDWMALEWHNLNFVFLRPHPDEMQELWISLQVHAKCIPRLMRRGFHMSRADVIAGRGYMEADGRDTTLTTENRRKGWMHSRTMFLEHHQSKDEDEGESKEWVGVLKIYARTYVALASFRMEMLTPSILQICEAWNWEKKLVYHYIFLEPDAAINTIYDDMPLEGWWPWPKAPTFP